MINWSIDREEDEKADEYLREFKEVLQQLNRPNIELVLQTFEIKKRMRDYNKEKNSKLREETEIIIMNWLTDASEKNISIMNAELQLCTLLLDEYIETGNNKLIQEIESRTSILLDKLKVEGREIPRIAILAYRLMVLWLRSRIQNDKKRSSEIEHLLSKTEEYAGVKGNKLLLKYLKDQREKYASIIEELEEIVEKYIESH